MSDPDFHSLAVDAEALLARIDAATLAAEDAGCRSALMSAAIKMDGAVIHLRRAAGDAPPARSAELLGMLT